MYEFEDHIRHFFNEEYAMSLLRNNFKIQKIESGDDKFYGRNSAYVKVIALAVK
jgi:hypothetical protein